MSTTADPQGHPISQSPISKMQLAWEDKIRKLFGSGLDQSPLETYMQLLTIEAVVDGQSRKANTQGVEGDVWSRVWKDAVEETSRKIQRLIIQLDLFDAAGVDRGS